MRLWLAAHAAFATSVARATDQDLQDACHREGDIHMWDSAWNTSVTFSYTFTKNEIGLMENVLASLESLRFCFNDVFIIIDVPHASPGGHRSFLDSKRGRKVVGKAEAVAAQAVDLLWQHCQGANSMQASWRVKVLDYDSQELREAVLKDYSDPKGVPDPLNLEPPKRALLENPKTWIYGHMYKTAMSTDALLRWPGNRYIFHADADMVVRRAQKGNDKVTCGQGLGFIEAALSLMGSDDRIYSVSPLIARFYTDSNKFMPGQEGKPFEGRWHDGRALASLFNVGESRLAQSFMDTQCLILDVERFRGPLPPQLPPRCG